MRFFQNISINQKIQLLVVVLLFVLYASSAFTVYSFSAKRLEQSTIKQMDVYMNMLLGIIAEADKQTDNSNFNHQDYAALKPYFNHPAYFSTDYPFLIDASGTYLIHLFREGQRYPREHLNQMFANPNKKGFFEYNEVKDSKEQRVIVFFSHIKSYNAFVGIAVNYNEVLSGLNTNRAILVLLILGGSLLFAFVINYALKPIIKNIKNINHSITLMSKGEAGLKIKYQTKDEVGQIANSLNSLIDGIASTAKFATEIGQNNLNSNFQPLGPNDALGNALLNMRESLNNAKNEEIKRKEEDSQRNWVNSGLARFGDILRQNNDNLQVLSDNVTQNLVNYVNAIQGGLFIINEDDKNEPRLDLLSAFAFNRKKFRKKTILLGEGLTGNCAIEKNTIYLKEIPTDYIEITSGLGDAPPKSILIVPLKLEETVFGVIEIASFNEFKGYEIEFVEKIGENIAATLSSVKNSIKTTQLLEQSQQQSEEMAAQEEEMRQNMEEMQATQEEMARKTIEMEGMTSAINETLLFCELAEDGSFIFTNTNFLNLVGYSKYDFESKSITEFIHPNDLSSFKDEWRKVKSNEIFKGTIKIVSRSNQEHFILCSLSPALDDNHDIYKIYFLGQDVTESKQLEIKAQEQAEEIEQSLLEIQVEQEISQQQESKIKALLQALDTVCLVTEFDADGKIVFINNRNEEVLGDKKETIEGRYHSELDYDAKHNPEKYKKFWSHLLDGNLQKREFSLKVKGKTVWIAEYYTPITNSEGVVNKIINIGVDISEGKENEVRLQKQIDELLQQLRK